MTIIVSMFLFLVALGIPVWFILSCIAFAKDRKNKTKPHSTGILVNFIISCVFFAVWAVAMVILAAFLVLTLMVIGNM